MLVQCSASLDKQFTYCCNDITINNKVRQSHGAKQLCYAVRIHNTHCDSHVFLKQSVFLYDYVIFQLEIFNCFIPNSFQVVLLPLHGLHAVQLHTKVTNSMSRCSRTNRTLNSIQITAATFLVKLFFFHFEQKLRNLTLKCTTVCL